VKGGLFLSVGVVQASGRQRVWPLLVLTAILALSLAGLPLTGGSVAKLAMKAPMGDGLVSKLGTLSAAGSALLMFHFLRRLRGTVVRPGTEIAPLRLAAPWLALLVASVAIPWGLYVGLGLGTVSFVLSPDVLWSASWPVLLGFLLSRELPGLERRLPAIPPGDIIGLAGGAGRLAEGLGAGAERLDGVLRLWPVAGVALLGLAVVLGLAMVPW
jgi:hypothetical protein